MKIVCSTNMPFVEEAFATIGQPVVIEGRSIAPEHVRDAQMLAVRSTTRIGRDLLEASAVRFAGSATIGTDHMDIPWLESRGIRWCFAPGCNANSVSEYVTAALLCLATRHGFSLRGKTLGVIGVGNVGSRVASKGRTLGMQVLLNDPPQADALRAGGDSAWGYAADDFNDLDAVLANADIVSLHVPLSRSGRYPTFHLAGRSFFSQAKPGVVFLNSARGPAVDTPELIAAIRSGRVARAVIDTWEGEPTVSSELADLCALATPHIAGHSFEGRAMGTVMVYQQACRFLDVQPQWRIDGRWPAPPVPGIDLGPQPDRLESGLWRAVSRVYDIESDDCRFRAALAGLPEQRSAAFDRLRREYPMRREFRFTEVRGTAATPAELSETLTKLGFNYLARS